MIEPTIVAALETLFPGAVYPDVAPQGTTHPFVTYQQVGGVPSNTLCGNTDKQNARLQFTVWADTRPQANTLMRQAEKLLIDPPIRGVSQGGLAAIFDAPTKAYGARQDLSFWAAN